MKEYVSPLELMRLVEGYKKVQVSVSYNPKIGVSQYFSVTPKWVVEKFATGLFDSDQIKISESNGELLIG
jgi:hypothetical protein